MSKHYLHVIKGKKESFKILDSETVKIVKQLSGQVPPNGIRYINDDTVLLQSNSVHDILDSIKNNGWAHSTNPSRVSKGFKVYIVPSNPVQAEYGMGAIGISFIADQDVYEDTSEEMKWASNFVDTMISTITNGQSK